MTDSIYYKNRSATFEFQIEDRLTAGMVLQGSEIKSIRLGKLSFRDSYCHFQNGELWVKKLYIGEYHNSGYAGHEPERDRKLLLQAREIRKWAQKVKEKGYTVVPLAVFINEKGWAKMEIGLGKGKKQHDKRQTIKDRDLDREMRRYKS